MFCFELGCLIDELWIVWWGAGFAGTNDSWGPQIKALTGKGRSNDDDGMRGVDQSDDNGEDGFGGNGVQICAFDNRGMGRSSVPTKNSEYSWVFSH